MVSGWELGRRTTSIGHRKTLWEEVTAWVRSPEKFFRNYTVRYLEHVFGRLHAGEPAAIAAG